MRVRKIKIKAKNRSNSSAIPRIFNADIDFSGLKLISHDLFRGSLGLNMKLSAPIFHLKRRANNLSRQEGIPLTKAQDRIATEEGFSNWSLLAMDASSKSISKNILSHLTPGDLVLMGARPGHGRTLRNLELLVDALNSGNRGVFFTLEYNENDVKRLLERIVKNATVILGKLEIYNSDSINADYIIDRVKSAPKGTVVVIDYLQLLDQNRNNPKLMDQVRSLKSFASQQKIIIVLISQIDRSYELSDRSCPGLDDVRLPNPLDLTLFDKTCFLNNGEVQIEAIN